MGGRRRSCRRPVVHAAGGFRRCNGTLLHHDCGCVLCRSRRQARHLTPQPRSGCRDHPPAGTRTGIVRKLPDVIHGRHGPCCLLSGLSGGGCKVSRRKERWNCRQVVSLAAVAGFHLTCHLTHCRRAVLYSGCSSFRQAGAFFNRSQRPCAADRGHCRDAVGHGQRAPHALWPGSAAAQGHGTRPRGCRVCFGPGGLLVTGADALAAAAGAHGHPSVIVRGAAVPCCQPPAMAGVAVSCGRWCYLSPASTRPACR